MVRTGDGPWRYLACSQPDAAGALVYELVGELLDYHECADRDRELAAQIRRVPCRVRDLICRGNWELEDER